MSITLKFKKYKDHKPHPNQKIAYFSTDYDVYGFISFNMKAGEVELSIEELDDNNFPNGTVYFIDSLEELKDINFKYKLIYAVNGEILSDNDYWMPINYYFNKIEAAKKAST